MTPIVHLGVERRWLGAARMLGDDNLGAAFVGVGDDGAAVEGLVADRTAESDAVNERRHADGIGAVAGQQAEVDKVAERVGRARIFVAMPPLEGLWPGSESPFAPWPWLAMVASTMGYSMSDSSVQASKSRTNTSALSRSRYCLKTVFQLPRKAGSVTGRLLPWRFRLTTSTALVRDFCQQIAGRWIEDRETVLTPRRKRIRIGGKDDETLRYFRWLVSPGVSVRRDQGDRRPLVCRTPHAAEGCRRLRRQSAPDD